MASRCTSRRQNRQSKRGTAGASRSGDRDGDGPGYTPAGPKGPKPAGTTNHGETVPREGATRAAVRGLLSALILRLKKLRLNPTLTWPWSPVGRQRDWEEADAEGRE